MQPLALGADRLPACREQVHLRTRFQDGFREFCHSGEYALTIVQNNQCVSVPQVIHECCYGIDLRDH